LNYNKQLILDQNWKEEMEYLGADVGQLVRTMGSSDLLKL